MEQILSLAVAIYGVYLLYVGNASGLTPMELGKGVSAIVAGLGYFAYLNRVKLYVVVTSVLQARDKVDVKTVDKKVDACSIFNPNDYEQKDFECLVHLRNRVTAANSVEGIETCAKLNEIIFSLDTVNKVAKIKKME
jgi:hypothetical protein